MDEWVCFSLTSQISDYEEHYTLFPTCPHVCLQLTASHESWFLLIAKLSWWVVSPDLIVSYNPISLMFSDCKCTNYNYVWHARCEWSKVYTSVVLKRFILCSMFVGICNSYLDTLPPYYSLCTLNADAMYYYSWVILHKYVAT